MDRLRNAILIVIIPLEQGDERGYHSSTMIKLNIRPLAAAAGIGNPLVFSKQSGLAYAMCYKLWNDQQTRIDLSTIDRLCEVLRCSPGELFIREGPNLPKRASPAQDRDQRPGHAEVAPVNCRRIRWID
jgi:putative transcriptional regulator